MNNNKTWYFLLVASILSVIVFVFMFLGFLLDIKYTIESVEGVGNEIIELSYNHVYSLSWIVCFQFLIIMYLLVIAKKN